MSSPSSCEELQDIDLELNLENSAFYDQFAITQVSQVISPKVSLFVHRADKLKLWKGILIIGCNNEID